MVLPHSLGDGSCLLERYAGIVEISNAGISCEASSRGGFVSSITLLDSDHHLACRARWPPKMQVHPAASIR